jgi:hypothetical protein
MSVRLILSYSYRISIKFGTARYTMDKVNFGLHRPSMTYYTIAS